MRFRITIFIALVLLIAGAGSVEAQQSWLMRYGPSITLPKYALTRYAPSSVDFPDVGPVYLPHGTGKTLYDETDLDGILELSRRDLLLRFTLGIYTDELKLDSDLIEPFGITDYNVYAQKSGLHAGVSAGYRLLGKRAAQVYLSGGFLAELFSTKTDLNPSDELFNVITSSSSGSSGNALVYYLNDRYRLPGIALTSSIDVRLFRITLSFGGEYRDTHIRLSGTDKPPLYNSSLTLKFQCMFTFGSKYK
jgi:hypothetical protein